MAREICREQVGKDANGRYTDEFKQKITECISRGLDSTNTARELGIEPFGSGFRQLYYKLNREYKLGETLPTLHASGLKSGEKNIADTGIKLEGNNKYTDEFKQKLEKYIADGLNDVDIAEKLGVDLTDKIFKRLYYSLVKEQKVDNSLSTEHIDNKKSEVDINSKDEDLVKENTTEIVEELKQDTKVSTHNKYKKSAESSKEVKLAQRVNEIETKDSEELLDKITSKFKSDIKSGKSMDYIIGSIDSKIDTLEQEIKFLRFLRSELSNKGV